MKNLIPLIAAALLVCAGSTAQSHPLPKASSPRPNQVLTISPSEIRMDFSEGLVAAFSGFEVDDQNGKAMELGKATLKLNDNKELFAPINGKLTPGTYTVKWHAVGIDTHHISGHYSFRVKA
jgi:copper resistance protein C